MIMSAAMGFFSRGLKNEFETAVVNEPSVFEPLKLCCLFLYQGGGRVVRWYWVNFQLRGVLQFG